MKFQQRISRHIFESVDKVRESRNKSRFIFVPYRIEICNNKREYAHELLLVFDTSKQQGENGYVKYFDLSHFTQTVPERIITTFFPNPPFPESFGINKNSLVNKDEVFQKEEGSMSCTYWAETFMLTMLEMNDKNKEKVFNGTLDRFFKFKVKDRFQKLRKTQFLTLPSSIRQIKSQPSISPNYWREKVKEKAIKSAPSKGVYIK